MDQGHGQKTSRAFIMCSHLQRTSCSGQSSSKKEQETALNGTRPRFLSEFRRCDTELGSCQTTTQGVETVVMGASQLRAELNVHWICGKAAEEWAKGWFTLYFFIFNMHKTPHIDVRHGFDPVPHEHARGWTLSNNVALCHWKYTQCLLRVIDLQWWTTEAQREDGEPLEDPLQPGDVFKCQHRANLNDCRHYYCWRAPPTLLHHTHVVF